MMNVMPCYIGENLYDSRTKLSNQNILVSVIKKATLFRPTKPARC